MENTKTKHELLSEKNEFEKQIKRINRRKNFITSIFNKNSRITKKLCLKIGKNKATPQDIVRFYKISSNMDRETLKIDDCINAIEDCNNNISNINEELEHLSSIEKSLSK